MKSLKQFWKNLSIAHKLNSVIGIMALLIVGELLTLRFAMSKLSAARALVGGESLWSKAQKDAVFSLQRFETSKNEKDFLEFKEYLKIPEGDHLARQELMKSDPDLLVVRSGFRQGQIHPDDIMPVIDLLRRFYWISYLERAIKAWSDGDVYMTELKERGIQYHDALKLKRIGEAAQHLARIKFLNETLTHIEVEFSEALGAGSRWLEHVILFLLTLAVLTVESVGITLAFLTNRSITKRLVELQGLANELTKGNFSLTIQVDSNDEIGKLGHSVNKMGSTLEASYRDLEKKVEERTAEARAAVEMRDEFLSIASHELRTPLTSLSLELQLLSRQVEKLHSTPEKQTALSMSEKSLNQVSRLTRLLDELLDLTRIQVGKFEVIPVHADLVPILHETVSKFSLEASQQGCSISIQSPRRLFFEFDPLRLEQVLVNLISNALKYGGGTPIEIRADQDSEFLTFSVRDQGAGIPLDKQSTLFDRFERAESNPHIKGLGLGLYITRQIILAHEGTITVESEPGRGATFQVKLPLKSS